MVCSVARFDVSFGTVFLMYVQIKLCPVKVAEWPPFGKYLLPQHTIRSLCILFVVLVISHFSFEDRSLVLAVPVPGHCLLFTFTDATLNRASLSVWH